MNKRRYYKTANNYRLVRRKCSLGQLKVLDDVDERFVLEYIENKSTAHRRRYDAVMYTRRRVETRDFLKATNFSRTRRDLKPIRSASTIYNRGRPHNKRSIQATRHVGLALFCTKKNMYKTMKMYWHIISVHLRKTFLSLDVVLLKVQMQTFSYVVRVNVICHGTCTGKFFLLLKEVLHYVCLDFSFLCTCLYWMIYH